MFQFHYTLTEEDYIKFNLNHALNTKLGKRSAVISKLSVPCIFVCFMLVSLTNGISQSSLIAQIIIFSITSILWIAFYKRIILRAIKKNIRMTQKSGRLPYNEHGTLVFNEDFICENGVSQETKTAYNLIEAIYTTNEALYIYNSAASAYILPYRCIENQMTFNNLADFLQAKTNKTIIHISK